MKPEVSLFWFRRDLRLSDNAALYHALCSGYPVVPVFIFDRMILDLLEDKKDARVSFIYATIQSLQSQLTARRASLESFYGTPQQAFATLLGKYAVRGVYANEDYEPYARERDEAVGRQLNAAQVPFKLYKDQVIFSRDEVLKDDGTPYTVFTPYARKWKSRLSPDYVQPYPVEAGQDLFFRQEPLPLPALESMGFSASAIPTPPANLTDGIIRDYGRRRDFPGLEGTSRLGIHLRFGTLSIRSLVGRAILSGEIFLNELIWREFYQMILWHFPAVGRGRAFKPAYDRICWRNDEKEFDRWCSGRTGYPLVDAGMRQLNATGFMHNRVRMVTASFLAKHLLIDWRWGEAYFAAKLLDFDLAANNGGWQWAAGCGCDAAPYFRIFNPTLQQRKFDPDGNYIRRWVSEPEGSGYPQPIVDHAFARKRATETYRRALKE
jgi:deoxyribodipyrimidine photo-lyase